MKPSRYERGIRGVVASVTGITPSVRTSLPSLRDAYLHALDSAPTSEHVCDARGFRASKKREVRREPFGKGTPITPNVAIEKWYRGQLNGIVAAMLKDYREKINEALEHPEVEKFYGDAAAQTIFSKVLKRLDDFWRQTFEGFASRCAPEFVSQAEAGATSATLASMSVAGLKAPIATYNEAVSNTLGAAVDFNHTLITGLQKETHEKIFNSIMLSLTSPNPEEQGSSGIENAIKEAGIKSKDRIDLITRDQTSKLYSSLSDERMEQNGCDEFEWMHSSAGKQPRASHERMDGRIFQLDDPRLWEVGGEFDLKKGDLGPPGWAINCRCRKIPHF